MQCSSDQHGERTLGQGPSLLLPPAPGLLRPGGRLLRKVRGRAPGRGQEAPVRAGVERLHDLCQEQCKENRVQVIIAGLGERIQQPLM